MFAFVLTIILGATLVIAADNSTTGCPAQVPTVRYQDSCLQFVKHKTTWTLARAACQKNGGDLVIIEDTAKEQFIENNAKALGWTPYALWIGATDIQVEGQWEWINGVNITWGKWGVGQGPLHGTKRFILSLEGREDCAAMRVRDSYKWASYPCDLGGSGFSFDSICEYKIDIAGTTLPNIETPAPTTLPNRETPAPAQTTLPNRETPAPVQTTLPNRETPAPVQTTLPNRETPAVARSTLPNRETPASRTTTAIIIG